GLSGRGGRPPHGLSDTMKHSEREMRVPTAEVRSTRRRTVSCSRAVASSAITVLLVGLLSACAGPVGVTPWTLHDAYRQTYANALSEGAPSVFSVQVLLRLGLFEQFKEDQQGALAKLHESLAARGDDDKLFALSELSFLHADSMAGDAASAVITDSGQPSSSEGSRAYYLASAVYAWAF